MYTIGRLARRVQVNPDSIRFYERQGLIAPSMTTDSGYKLYSEETVRRITFIKHARRCGFALSEISQLLHMDSSEAAVRSVAYRLAAAKQAEIDDTIEALRTMSEALSCMIDARESDEREAVPFEKSALMNALQPGLTPSDPTDAESNPKKEAAASPF